MKRQARDSGADMQTQ